MKVFMRRITLALIVAGAVGIAAILPSVIESGPNWEERMRELERTYPFISVHDEGGYYSQSIDKDAAERAGISKRRFCSPQKCSITRTGWHSKPTARKLWTSRW